jgi:hypothetical protein
MPARPTIAPASIHSAGLEPSGCCSVCESSQECVVGVEPDEAGVVDDVALASESADDVAGQARPNPNAITVRTTNVHAGRCPSR